MSYYFPPSGGPGVQRVLKFVRYMPEFGWRPIVLTVPEHAEFPVRDESLARDIPSEARVVRSPILEFYSAYRFLSGQRSRAISLDMTTVARREGIGARIFDAVRASLFIPDGRVGWLPGGTREGLRVCREDHPAVVFASGPPFTTHLIGQRIARKSGLPLVVDFRDPWTRAPFYPKRPGWARRLDERLERACLRDASAVVTVNRAIRDDLLSRYPELDERRFVRIPNGFDPADFDGRSPSRGPRWTLVHTGSLQAARIPRGLLAAIEGWLAAHPDLESRIQLRFVGRLDADLHRLLERPPLDRITRIDGYLPHGESVQALLDADLLLLLIGDDPQGRGMLTGKVFEYLGSGSPILALAPEGEAAELLRSTGAGRVVSPDDTPAIRTALEEAWGAHARGERPFGAPAPEVVSAYSRRFLTGRLAAVFDAAARGLPPPR